MKRLILITMFLGILALGAQAQNKIDKLVDTYSTLGSSVFTTAVKRDPQTRAVKKVVKVLQVQHPKAETLVSTFRDVARQNPETTEQQANGTTTLIMAEQQPNQVRIYMLEYQKRTVVSSAKVTIICSFK